MIQLTDKNFDKEIIKLKGLALVDFYADWCGPCQMLGPVIEELSKDPELKKIKFGKVDTEQYPKLAEDNTVQGIPCMIIFQDGKEIQRIVGYSPKPVLKNKILAIIVRTK